MEPDLFTVHRDNLKTQRAIAREKALDAKMEQHFRSHPELQHGRDYRMNTMRFQVPAKKISDRFDETFAEAPDSPDWWKNQFCEVCEYRRSMCKCL